MGKRINLRNTEGILVRIEGLISVEDCDYSGVLKFCFFFYKNRSLDVAVEYLDRCINPRFLGRDSGRLEE